MKPAIVVGFLLGGAGLLYALHALGGKTVEVRMPFLYLRNAKGVTGYPGARPDDIGTVRLRGTVLIPHGARQDTYSTGTLISIRSAAGVSVPIGVPQDGPEGAWDVIVTDPALMPPQPASPGPTPLRRT